MKLKSYPEYKDSDFNWVPEVPNSWDVVKTKRFCQILTGGTPRKDNLSYWEGGNINWMTSGEVNKRRVKETNNKITKAGLLNSNARILPKNSIMIALSGQGKTKGTVAILDIPTCCSQSLGAYACDENKLHYNYLFYYLTSKYRDIRWLVGDSQREGLSLSIIEDIYTLAPSLKEQVKIGHFLDKKTSEIDLTIEKDTHLIELLKEKRTALINHVVTKGLDPTVKMKDSGVEWIGEIPEDWTISRFTNHIGLKHGHQFGEADFTDYGPRIVKITQLKENGVIDLSHCSFIDENRLSQFRKYLLKEGDVLMALSGATLGKVARIDFPIENTLQNYRVGKFIPINGTHNSFIYYILLSKCFNEQMNLFVVQTAQGNVGKKDFKQILIPIPKIEEQIQISEFLDYNLKKIDVIIENIRKNIELLEEYKKSLIHHVVTGKVDVREVAV